jgi:hypothetical protein
VLWFATLLEPGLTGIFPLGRISMRSLATLLPAILLLVSPLSSLAASTPAPQPKTAEAVLSADNGWEKAEETGDAAYVDNLLLDGYRSVNADGTVHDKATIVAKTRKHSGSPDYAAKVKKWMADHPEATSVVLRGDTAVVTFYLKPLGPEKGIMSSDIFTYIDGGWHAIYSQHTSVGQ